MKCIEFEIIDRINSLLDCNLQVVVAIDGRCASGKTTLANRLKELLDCNVIHMDHFFLPIEKRTTERLSVPGGNFDRERFISQVLCNVVENKGFFYSPYNCRTNSYDAPVILNPNRITVIEGVYSCHPELIDNYSLKIFLDISFDEQKGRIIKRNGEKRWEDFERKWIPLEEKYFSCLDIARSCDMVYENN